VATYWRKYYPIFKKRAWSFLKFSFNGYGASAFGAVVGVLLSLSIFPKVSENPTEDTSRSKELLRQNKETNTQSRHDVEETKNKIQKDTGPQEKSETTIEKPTYSSNEHTDYKISLVVDKYKSKLGRGWDYIDIRPDPYICIGIEENIEQAQCIGRIDNFCKNKYSCSLTARIPASQKYFIWVLDQDAGTADDFIGEGLCELQQKCRLQNRSSSLNSATVFIETK
jgi:hypothetical protein